MVVNPDVDSYTKAVNHRRILQKTQENNNQPKSNRILKPKYCINEMGAQFSHLLQFTRGVGGDLSLCPPVSYATDHK